MPTVIELRKLASAKNIKGRSKMNKAQLMHALNIKNTMTRKASQNTSKNVSQNVNQNASQKGITLVEIPHFYRDRLINAKWRRMKNNRHRCYIALRARKKFRMVPLDDTQKQEIDELLRSCGIVDWETERFINCCVTTSCGYYIYVPTDQFEKRNMLPHLPDDIARRIRSCGNKNTLVM